MEGRKEKKRKIAIRNVGEGCKNRVSMDETMMYMSGMWA